MPRAARRGRAVLVDVAVLVFDVQGGLLGGVVGAVIQLEDVALLGLILFGRLLSGRTEFDIPAVRLRHLTLLSVETYEIGSGVRAMGQRAIRSKGSLAGGGAEEPVHKQGEALVEAIDQRHHDADENQHNAGVAEQLTTGGGDDLAKLDERPGG